jgi:hypothetical protein
MKGTIFTVIRLILFIGILILLPKMVTKAQFIDACSTFTAPTAAPAQIVAQHVGKFRTSPL